MEVKSRADFYYIVTECNSNCYKKIFVFYADWHQPAMQLIKLLKPLQEDFSGCFSFYTVNMEEAKEVFSNVAKIDVVPTILFYEGHLLVGKMEGFDSINFLATLNFWKEHNYFPASCRNMLQKEVSYDKGRANDIIVPIEKKYLTIGCQEMSTNSSLEFLVNSSNIMLFIKGKKSEPFCKFSKEAVRILNKYEVNFSTFDILNNENVRTNLKKYSDWPTYPQLYVMGEFIGGVDIIKEFDENKTLETILNKNELDAFNIAIQNKPLVLIESQMDQEQNERMQHILHTSNVQNFHIINAKLYKKIFRADKKLSPRLYKFGIFICNLKILNEIFEVGGPKEVYNFICVDCNSMNLATNSMF